MPGTFFIFTSRARRVVISASCLFAGGDIKLVDLGYLVVVALDDRDAQLHVAGLDAVVGLDQCGVAYAASGGNLLYMHTGRDEDMAVAGGFDHHGLYIIDGLTAVVVDLKDHLAQLIAAYAVVAVGIDETSVAYLYRRRIGYALGDILHARRTGQHLRGLGALLAVTAIAGGELDAVVAAVVLVEAAAISGFALLCGHGLLGAWTLAPLTAGIGVVAIVALTLATAGISAVVIALLSLLVGGVTDDASQHGATRHAHDGTHVVTARSVADATDGTTQYRTEGGTGIGALSGVGAASAHHQERRSGYCCVLFPHSLHWF